MPNWCKNSITIDLDTEDGRRVAEIFRTQEFPFQAIRPCPQHLLEGDGWYGWRTQNWGTKWDAESLHVLEENDESITFDFDTAWSPPSALYRFMADEFPELNMEFEYVEYDNDFAGQGYVNYGDFGEQDTDPPSRTHVPDDDEEAAAEFDEMFADLIEVADEDKIEPAKTQIGQMTKLPLPKEKK